jgi:NTE family protein
MIKLSNIKHLVLSGGGLLGISYIGLFKYLEEHNAVSQIKTITGCSAGAIFGSFLAVGYTSVELDKIIKKLNFKDYLNITAESIINFMRLKGLESGKALIDFIKQCIKDKTDEENITFGQIQERFNINIRIGVTNLTTSKFEVFDSYSMPNLPVYKAINASIAIPFIFEPVIINNYVYCDGGLLDNLPIENIINLENTLHNIKLDVQELHKAHKIHEAQESQ